MKIHIFPILLLLLFVVIFFTKEIFFNHVAYCCDNIAINVPSKVFLIEQLKHGKFPLLNPYILSGSPFLADINLGLLSPFNVLYFFFSPFRALTEGIILNFILSAVGMYVLAKSLKLSSFGSLISSIVFTFSGTMVTYTNNVPMLHVASLLPWVMWAWMRYFSRPSKRFFLILSYFLTMQIFAGHPQFTYYTWLLGVSYVLFVSQLPLKKRVGLLVILSGFVFLLSSIQLLPFFEFARSSTRIHLGFTYASFDSMHPLNIARFILPNLVGNLSTGTDWTQGGSVYGFIGLIPILLLFCVSLRDIRVRFFLLIFLGSFVLSLGKFTPVFYLAYRLIPGVGLFRSPEHFLYLYTFAGAVLAGFGSDGVFAERRNLFLRLLFYVGFLYIVASVWSLSWSDVVLIHLHKFRTYSSSDQGEIQLLIFLNFVFSGVLLWCVYRWFRKEVIIIAVFLELLIFSSHGIISIPEQRLNGWFNLGKGTASLMQDMRDTKYRMFVTPALYFNPVKKKFGKPYTEDETRWQIEILRTNINMFYHLPTIDGYASMIYAPYKEVFQKDEGDPTGITFSNYSLVPWNILGVRYVLASPTDGFFKTSLLFAPIWSDEHKILYRNDSAQASEVVGYHLRRGTILAGSLLTDLGIILYFVIIFWRRRALMSQTGDERYLPAVKRRARRN